MTAYSKTVVVWNKDSFNNMSSTVLGQISAKRQAMIAAGTMHEQQGFKEDSTTVTDLNRFTTRAAAEEWIAFIDDIATANSLNKISSRITDVEKTD